MAEQMSESRAGAERRHAGGAATSWIKRAFRRSPPPASCGDMANASGKEVVIAYASELMVMCRMAEQAGDIEVGGHLHGSFTPSGKPILALVTPPGSQSVRRRAQFVHDIEHWQKIDEFLVENHGLATIGRAHSHHGLGMPNPSRGDEDTGQSLLRRNGRERFVEIVVSFE